MAAVPPTVALLIKQPCLAYVSFVVSPEEVWIQRTDGEAELSQLMSDLNSGGQQLPTVKGPVTGHELYAAAYSVDQRLYRVVVTGQQSKGVYVVHFIDYGNFELKQGDELRSLDARFAALPCQAVRCHLEGVSTSAVADLQTMVLDKPVSVTALSQSPSTGSYSVDIIVDSCSVLAVLRSRYPVNQQQSNSHVSAVVGGEAGFGPAVPPGSRQQQSGRSTYGEPRLPPVDRRVDVTVTDCEEPFRFCVCLREHESDLTRLVQAIESHMEGGSRNGISGWDATLASGMPCLAQSNSDWRWHRARIEEVVPKGQLKVYFVDYGSSEIVSLSKIADMPPKLLQVPPLAIECCLVGISVPDDLFENAVIEFRNLLSQPPIQMVVRSTTSPSGPIPVSLFVVNGSSSVPNASVSELLMQAGLGERISPNAGAGEPAAAAAANSGGLGSNGTKGNVGGSKPAFSRLGYKQRPLPQPGTTATATCVYIETPSSFWCQLLLSEVDIKRVEDEMAKLNDGGTHALSAITGTPVVGQPCCARFSLDGQWYRARVRESSGGKCLVDFVDYGNREWVSFPHDLRQLPSNLLAIAPLAVHCTMAASGRRGATAALPSTTWTADQCQEFEKTVLYQTVELEVFAVTGDSVLLVDVIARSGRVSELVKSTGGGSVLAPVQRSRPDDARSALAHHLPESTTRRDQPLAVAIDGGRSQSTGTTATTLQAVAAGVRERVRVVWIIAPDHFYCHRESSDGLLQLISRGVDETVKAGRQLRRPAVGTLCVACYSLDGQWYRALIKALSTASCSLYFIDYGNTANAAGNTPLLEIEPRLAEIPPQAINCKLRGVAPRSLKGEWSDDARNKMELLINSGELYATFVACHRDSSLVDLTLADGTSVADELVAAGVAKPLRGDVPLGGSQTHSGSHSPSTGAADAGGPRMPAVGDGLLLSGEQSSPRRSLAASQSGFTSALVRQDAGHGHLAGRPEFDQAPAASQSGGRYRSTGAAAATTGLASPVWAGPGSPGTTSNSSGTSSWSDANRKGGVQHHPSGNFRPPVRNDRGGPPRTTGRHDYGGNDSEDVSPRGRLGGPEGRSPFDRQAEVAASLGDGMQRPGRSYRKPVERFGQQPRRPREAGWQQKQEHSSEFAADFDEASDRRLPATAAAAAWQQGPNRSRAKEGQGQSDDWLEESKQSTSAVASAAASAKAQRGTDSSSYRRTDLIAGSAYAAYLAYMPPQTISDDSGSSLLIWIQLRQNEALVETVQEAVRQCTSESSAQDVATTLTAEPGVGTPCLAVYSADSAWYRAVTTAAANKSVETVSVHFVDYGNTDTVPMSQLREIPSALLQSAPPLAIGCKVADADKLMDGLSEVTADAVREKLECHTLMVTFSESVSGYDGRGLLPCHVTLLDESDGQATEDAAAVDTACAAIGAVQLADEAAVDQPEMKNQPGDADDVTIIVGYSPTELQPGVQYRATLAAYGTSPDEFWLHLERDSEAMTELGADILRYVEESNSDEGAFVSAQPTIGTSCLAKYSADGLWYRAEVAVLHPDTATVELLYVDYGNTDIVQWPSRSVMQLPAKLGQLPCFAVLCSLASDSPATLQDFDNETADCIVAVFCNAPADHRKAALCTLMSPCLRDLAEDDETGSAQEQAIIVNDEEELVEEANESMQQNEQEGQHLENVTEPTLANVSAPETVESTGPVPTGDEESGPDAAISEAAGSDGLLPILPDCSGRATRVEFTLSAAHRESATEADSLEKGAALTHETSDMAVSSSAASFAGVATSVRALSPTFDLSAECGTVGAVPAVATCEQSESASFTEADARQGPLSEPFAEQPQLADNVQLSGRPGVASLAGDEINGSGKDLFRVDFSTASDRASERCHESAGLPAVAALQCADSSSRDFAERSDADDDISICEDLSLVSATCGPSTSLGTDEPTQLSAVAEGCNLADTLTAAAPDDSVASAADFVSSSDGPEATWPQEDCLVPDQAASSFGPSDVDAITLLASDCADGSQDLCPDNAAASGLDGELECSPADEALERDRLDIGPAGETCRDGDDVVNFASAEDLSGGARLPDPSGVRCTEAVDVGGDEHIAEVGVPQPNENATTDAGAGACLEDSIVSTSLETGEGVADSASGSNRIILSGLGVTTGIGCDSSVSDGAPESDQSESAAGYVNISMPLKSDAMECKASDPALQERSKDDRRMLVTQEAGGGLSDEVNAEEIEAQIDHVASVLGYGTDASAGCQRSHSPVCAADAVASESTRSEAASDAENEQKLSISEPGAFSGTAGCTADATLLADKRPVASEAKEPDDGPTEHGCAEQGQLQHSDDRTVEECNEMQPPGEP